MPYEHKDTNSMQDIKEKQRKNVTNTISDNEHKNNGEKYCETQI